MPPAGALYISSTDNMLPTLVVTGRSNVTSNSAGSISTNICVGGFANVPAMWAVRIEGASRLEFNEAAYVSRATTIEWARPPLRTRHTL